MTPGAVEGPTFLMLEGSPVARLFHAYVMVDWSASSKPKTGSESIWIGVLKRDVRFQLGFESLNPPTRSDAEKRISGLLDEFRKRGERVLLGFDFSLGLPRGSGRALKLKDESWKGVWSFLSANVVDKADNTNNRFAVASKMNRIMTDEARPFWGAPPKDVQRWLTSTKPAEHGADVPPLLRHAETAARGAKPIWQIFGNGTVGSQTLLGIPAVRRLKSARGDSVTIWPFETGWRPLAAADVEDVEAVVAEIYPSLLKAEPGPGEVRDLAQVRALCQHFARLDEAGKLAAAFGPPRDTPPDVVLDVEAEEGWILGA